MLKELQLKKVYDSENNNLLEEFYIPVLKETKIYKRITGYYSSSSLVVAAEGIAELFINGGRFNLITGVLLSENDYHTLLELFIMQLL